jgi:hypothetical protein
MRACCSVLAHTFRYKMWIQMYGFVCLRISVEREFYTRRSKRKYVKSLRFSQNCEVYKTAKPAYNGIARDRNFFHDWQLPFHTGTWRLDLRDCKSFPLKTGLRSARVPFKRDFSLLTLVCGHFLTFVYVIYNRMSTWNSICVTWCWTVSPRVHSVKRWYSVSLSSAFLSQH